MITKIIQEKFPKHIIENYLSPYESKTKVLFSGLGADEVFGGYARYFTA